MMFNGTVDIHSPNDQYSRKICFILATNNEAKAQKFVRAINSILEMTQSHLIIVASRTTFLNLETSQLVNVISTNAYGVSAARNFGLDTAIEMQIKFDFVIFPNDDSIIPLECIAALISQPLTESVLIGGWKSPSGKMFLKPRKLYDSEVSFLSVYEPAIVFPRSVFQCQIRFKENVGTGSEGIIQSGEGAFILQDIHRLGIKINSFSDFWVINPHTIRDSNVESPKEKIIRYSPAVIIYIESINESRLKKLFFELAASISPLIRYLLFQQYWREAGLRLTLTAIQSRMRCSVESNKFRFCQIFKSTPSRMGSQNS